MPRYTHPPIPAVSAVRPSSLRRLRSASPTADHSTSPTKRKTDDCTPLRGRPPSVHSIPPRHQTCRAESSTSAHFPDKSAQSAATPQRYRSSPSFTPARVPPAASPSLPLQSRHHRCHHTSDLRDLRPSPPPLTPLRILTRSHSAALHSRSFRLHYARSAPNPTRLPNGPQTPAVFAPLTCRQGIYKTARTIASGIRPSAISSRSLKSLRQKTFPKVKLIKTAFTSPGTFPYYPASSASVIPRTSSHDIFQRAVSNSLPPSHTAGPAPLQPPDSRHLRNIIQPLLCDCPSGLPPAGAPPTLHTIRIMLSICLHLLLESGPARSLFISVPASPLSQRRERRPRHPPIWLSASTRCVSGQRLRPLPTTGAHRLRLSPLQSPPHHPHPTRNCMSSGQQIRCGSVSRAVHKKPSPDRNKPVPERRAVSSYSFETAPGKPSADSHSAQRSDESAVLRSAACGRSSPSATPITINTDTVAAGPRDSVRLRRPQTLCPKRKTAAARSRKSTDFLVNRSLAGL